MTTQALMTLIAISLLKGAAFGALFAWIFPPMNRYALRKMSRDAAPSQQAISPSRHYCGLAVLSGSGFALMDLVGLVSDAAGLPELLRWVAVALFAASTGGTVLIVSSMPRQQTA